MATARRVEQYMMQHNVGYDVVAHPHSHSSLETARLAHIPAECLAKSVVLEDDDGYVMAVLASTQHVKLTQIGRELNRKLRLATEDELTGLFADCETGAIPPVGLAYGMPTIVDEALIEQPQIYFEAGDHESLIRMNRDAFVALMEHADHGRFARTTH